MADIGRLALRREGNWWNAYYAQQNTMEDAVLIGSIQIGAVIANTECKALFMVLMQGVVSEFIKEKTGFTVKWNKPEKGSEHERAGHS